MRQPDRHHDGHGNHHGGLDDQLRTNILILDACRNNPMAPQVAAAGAGRAIEGGGGLAAPSSLGQARRWGPER